MIGQVGGLLFFQPTAEAADRSLSDSFGNSYTLHFPVELKFRDKWNATPDATSWQFDGGGKFLVVVAVRNTTIEKQVDGYRGFLSIGGKYKVSKEYHNGYYELRSTFPHEGHISNNVALVGSVRGSCIQCVIAIILEWETNDNLVEMMMREVRADMSRGITATPTSK
jgi:hypothetical protein